MAGALRALVGVLLCGVSAVVAAGVANDAAIEGWIAAHARKLKGMEQRARRQAVVGDLDGDGRHDVAVLYTIQHAKPGNRELRYLAVFRRSAKKALQYKAHAMVGGLGIREVNRVTILGRVIELEMLAYGPLDPACCPTLVETSRYRLTAGRLVRVKAGGTTR